MITLGSERVIRRPTQAPRSQLVESKREGGTTSEKTRRTRDFIQNKKPSGEQKFNRVRVIRRLQLGDRQREGFGVLSAFHIFRLAIC